MVRVAISAMVAPHVKDSAEVRSPGDDEVKLVPVVAGRPHLPVGPNASVKVP